MEASGAPDQKGSNGLKGPLSGIRVIDLTTVIMGPSATQILGDLGADVIKVESAGGDSLRWIGPNRTDGMGPLYLNANRNKRSVVLDLKDAEDRGALLSLVADADVFVSNVRPQAMARLGLGYERGPGCESRDRLLPGGRIRLRWTEIRSGRV